MSPQKVVITFEVEADDPKQAVRIMLSVLDNRGLQEDSAIVDYWVTSPHAQLTPAKDGAQ